jgi:hypothetical protein
LRAVIIEAQKAESLFLQATEEATPLLPIAIAGKNLLPNNLMSDRLLVVKKF